MKTKCFKRRNKVFQAQKNFETLCFKQTTKAGTQSAKSIQLLSANSRDCSTHRLNLVLEKEARSNLYKQQFTYREPTQRDTAEYRQCPRLLLSMNWQSSLVAIICLVYL